jgi:hypothetical protein
VVSCGRKDYAGDDAPIAAGSVGNPWAWHVFLRWETASLLSPQIVFASTTDPAWRSCIFRTGPPAA